MKTTNAMFADEAGTNDFFISSAGHGQFGIGVTYAKLTSDGESILTSSSLTDGNEISSSSNRISNSDDDDSKGCYLSSRSLEDGSLNWRRNVCGTSSNTSSNNKIRHAVYSNEDDNFVYTLDDTGSLRQWDDTNGNLIQQISISNISASALASASSPRLFSISDTVLGCVLGGGDKTSVSASAYDIMIEGGKMTLNSNISQSTILKKANDNEGKSAKTSASATIPNVRSLECNHINAKISKGGKIDVYDSSSSVAVASIEGKDLGFSHGSDSSSNTNTNRVKFVEMIQCESNGSLTGLITSHTGTTAVFQITAASASTSIVKKWSAEEGFGSVTSTTFLDWIDDSGDNDESTGDDEDAILSSLSFNSRFNSQYQSLVNYISGGFMEQIMSFIHKSDGGNDNTSNSNKKQQQLGQKQIIFGLKKVAVMLSNPFSKLIGVNSVGGDIVWSMNLNTNASWHKVVHGASTSRSSVFGHGMHHPHSPEILVLSQLSSSSDDTDNDTIEWRCIDGLKGRIISQSSIPIPKSSSVVQILPIHAHSNAGGGCKQNALLVLEDNSYVVVPNTSQSVTETSKIIDAGLYSHKVDKENGLFTTMKIGKVSEETVVIGQTLFDPTMEKIVNVAYPQRNEVVQSPATISGDDSLLLKYLNPHLCVVVTEATEGLIDHLYSEEGDNNAFYNALSLSNNGSGSSEKKQKTKPVGVTKPGEEPPKVVKTASPTLFINLVDTVSGQILYRVSHAHVGPGATHPNDSNVPVVISENWVVYAFPNAKSRRTELGVITLHEGMIDKQGITAFSTPEQQESFSSFTSAKPIALTKTYALPLPVSAIGVTNTKNGISSKNILLATGAGGQVVRIDRRLLDPRRPSGEPKDSEKKEGLMQYAPLLPIPPMMIQSYTNYVEGVTSIQSTAANLESQTLVIAYGGPDVFFARYAPSKGFDSLPESFNKFAIIMVLVGLYAVLKTLKKMSEKKFVKLGWS